MAKKITQLTQTVSLSASNELFEIVQDSNSRSCDITQILDYIEANASTFVNNLIIHNSAPQLRLSESTDTYGDWHITVDGESWNIRYPDTGTSPYPLQIITSSGTATEVRTFGNRVLDTSDTGSGNGLDADLLDAQHGSYYLDWGNFTSTPTTLSGYGITDSWRAWNSGTDADIDALLPGSTSGTIYEGVANTHVVIGIRGNDSNDGFYIIDTDNGGAGAYAQLLLAVNDNECAYKGNSLIIASDVTFENLDANGDVGTGAAQVAQGNHTHTFASLTSKPTTLAGYGITDAVWGDGTDNGSVTIQTTDSDFLVADSNASGAQNYIWRDHSASVLYLGAVDSVVTLRSDLDLNSYDILNGPTTLAGYGITDAVPNDTDSTITLNDTTCDTPYYGLILDHNVSGTDACTADRNHVALYIDVDSSATGGDTSNEHRLYGAYINVNMTGDSDLVYGSYGIARVNQSAGTVTNLAGYYNYAQADNSGGTVVNAFGTFSLGYEENAGAVTNLYGGYFKTLKQVGSQATSPLHVGIYGEVEIDEGTITNARAIQAHIDLDAGTIDTAYLFYGTYATTSGVTTAYGVYIPTVVDNYFGGTVSVDGDITMGGNTVYTTADSSVATAGDTLVLRDADGDINGRYIVSTYVSMSHATGTRTSDTIFYSSTDSYIRKNDASGFRTSLDVYATGEAATFAQGALADSAIQPGDQASLDRITLTNNESLAAADGLLWYDLNDSTNTVITGGDSSPAGLFISDGTSNYAIWHNGHFDGIGTGSTQVAQGNHTHAYSAITGTHGNEDHSSTFITSTGVTYENLSANGDVGTGSSQVAQGNHTHTQIESGSNTISISSTTASIDIGGTNYLTVLPTGNTCRLGTTTNYLTLGPTSETVTISLNSGYTVSDWTYQGLRLGATGARVNEFSTDETLGGDSDTAVPTEQAVKAYVDNNKSYAITLAADGSFDPADATTYYYGAGALWNIYAIGGVIFPVTGTVTAISLAVQCAAHTSESWSFYLRINGTTDNLITTFASTDTIKTYTGAKSISVTAGDSMIIKTVTPTWTTNPIGVWSTCVLYIET